MTDHETTAPQTDPTADAIQAATAARASMVEALATIRSAPSVPVSAWVDALALHFGADEVQAAAKPSSDAAERLVVDLYDRLHGLSGKQRRSEFTGLFRRGDGFSQRAFLEQFGEHLIGRPVVTEQDRGTAKKALQRWRKKYPSGVEK